MKKFTAKHPDNLLVEKAKKEIKEFEEEEEKGNLAIYYFDETIFSLESNVPYAWQKINKNIKIPSSKSKSIKALGFLNTKKNDLKSYMTTDRVDSDLVIASFGTLLSNKMENKQL